MRSIARRVKKLESRHCDATGLVPHSEEWFDFFQDKFMRSLEGEDVRNSHIPSPQNRSHAMSSFIATGSILPLAAVPRRQFRWSRSIGSQGKSESRVKYLD